MSSVSELDNLRKQNENLERLLEKERDLRVRAERLVRERFRGELDDLDSFPAIREAMWRILKNLDKLQGLGESEP